MYDTEALAKLLQGRTVGQKRDITGLSDADDPQLGAIIVVSNEKELKQLIGADLGALVVPEHLEKLPQMSHSCIVVKDSRLALAKLSRLFDQRPLLAEGIDANALIHPTAQLADDVHIAAGAIVEAGAFIDSGSRLGAACVIGQGVRLGKDCLIYPQVSLYPGCFLGDRVTVHSGAVLGSDGFGYAAGPKGAVKIHHLGRVVVGDDVEIGANTCIDRATLSETRIGARSKIDNHCQIGHNVTVGNDCLIAGMVGIAGSTHIGNRVIIGGSAGIGDHIRIGNDARIAGRAGITKDVPAGETWAGFPAEPYKKFVRKLYLQNQLERIWKRFKNSNHA